MVPNVESSNPSIRPIKKRPVFLRALFFDAHSGLLTLSGFFQFRHQLNLRIFSYPCLAVSHCFSRKKLAFHGNFFPCRLYSPHKKASCFFQGAFFDLKNIFTEHLFLFILTLFFERFKEWEFKVSLSQNPPSWGSA